MKFSAREQGSYPCSIYDAQEHRIPGDPRCIGDQQDTKKQGMSIWSLQPSKWRHQGPNAFQLKQNLLKHRKAESSETTQRTSEANLIFANTGYIPTLKMMT
jgi:Zn-finger protein